MDGRHTATSSDCFTQTHEYVNGEESQRVCAALLMGRGWYVVPSYDYTGGNSKSPKMQGEHAGLILPDLDICRAGVRRWVEVKYKRAATLHRKTGRLEHGLEIRLLNHYLKVEEQSGAELFLMIHEGVTGDILFASMRDINKSPYRRNYYPNGKTSAGRKYGEMAFFPRDQFVKLGNKAHSDKRSHDEKMRSYVSSGKIKMGNVDTFMRRVVFSPDVPPPDEVELFAHQDELLTLVWPSKNSRVIEPCT